MSFDLASIDLRILGLVILGLTALTLLVALFRRPRPDFAPLTGAIEDLRRDLARVEQELQTSERRIEASAEARDSRQRQEIASSLRHTGETLAGAMKAIGETQQTRLDTVAARLQALSESMAQSQDRLRERLDQNLQSLRKENEAKLEQMRATVDEKLQATLEARLQSQFQTVSERLERVHQGLGEMQVLAGGVGDLKKMLSGVKTRGTFGEEQLDALLEQVLTEDQLVRNARPRADSTETVEFAIRLPEGVLLPIDSKFPQEDYERLIQAVEAGDAEAAAKAGTALERRMRDEAKRIATKYICPPTTTDFAVLFVPTEGLFAEVLRRPGLRESIREQHRVTILGPTTLGAFLSSLRMGFRTLAIQEKSAEIWQVLGAVKTEFRTYGELMAKVEKKLQEGQNVIHQIGVRSRAIHRKLREVEELPMDRAAPILELDAPEAEMPAPAEEDTP
ncbi:DNA recombination protein RmuC [Inquilinus limosus]|uniref:DNA recombination protein RmuC n=1 Tax=Inquilinus limosus TaxID=171674 RepID=UPI0003FE543C|nr:DNA recombination protein RmuC [Inquilinus limosus]